MKKVFLKIIYMILSFLVFVFEIHNFCYAGSIGDSPYGTAFALAFLGIGGGFIFIICLIPYLVLKKKHISAEKYKQEIIDKDDNNISNKRGNFLIYAFILGICFWIMFSNSLVFGNKNEIIILYAISIISIILMIIFSILIYTDVKNKKLENEGKTRTISKEKLDKNITIIKNCIYFGIILVAFLEMFNYVNGFMTVVLFLIASLIIKILDNKKLATVICFIILILAIAFIIKNYIKYGIM